MLKPFVAVSVSRSRGLSVAHHSDADDSDSVVPSRLIVEPPNVSIVSEYSFLGGGTVESHSGVRVTSAHIAEEAVDPALDATHHHLPADSSTVGMPHAQAHGRTSAALLDAMSSTIFHKLRSGDEVVSVWHGASGCGKSSSVLGPMLSPSSILSASTADSCERGQPLLGSRYALLSDVLGRLFALSQCGDPASAPKLELGISVIEFRVQDSEANADPEEWGDSEPSSHASPKRRERKRADGRRRAEQEVAVDLLQDFDGPGGGGAAASAPYGAVDDCTPTRCFAAQFSDVPLARTVLCADIAEVETVLMVALSRSRSWIADDCATLLGEEARSTHCEVSHREPGDSFASSSGSVSDRYRRTPPPPQSQRSTSTPRSLIPTPGGRSHLNINVFVRLEYRGTGASASKEHPGELNNSFTAASERATAGSARAPPPPSSSSSIPAVRSVVSLWRLFDLAGPQIDEFNATADAQLAAATHRQLMKLATNVPSRPLDGIDDSVGVGGLSAQLLAHLLLYGPAHIVWCCALRREYPFDVLSCDGLRLARWVQEHASRPLAARVGSTHFDAVEKHQYVIRRLFSSHMTPARAFFAETVAQGGHTLQQGRFRHSLTDAAGRTYAALARELAASSRASPRTLAASSFGVRGGAGRSGADPADALPSGGVAAAPTTPQTISLDDPATAHSDSEGLVAYGEPSYARRTRFGASSTGDRTAGSPPPSTDVSVRTESSSVNPPSRRFQTLVDTVVTGSNNNSNSGGGDAVRRTGPAASASHEDRHSSHRTGSLPPPLTLDAAPSRPLWDHNTTSNSSRPTASSGKRIPAVSDDPTDGDAAVGGPIMEDTFVAKAEYQTSAALAARAAVAAVTRERHRHAHCDDADVEHGERNWQQTLQAFCRLEDQAPKAPNIAALSTRQSAQKTSRRRSPPSGRGHAAPSSNDSGSEVGQQRFSKVSRRAAESTQELTALREICDAQQSELVALRAELKAHKSVTAVGETATSGVAANRPGLNGARRPTSTATQSENFNRTSSVQDTSQTAREDPLADDSVGEALVRAVEPVLRQLQEESSAVQAKILADYVAQKEMLSAILRDAPAALRSGAGDEPRDVDDVRSTSTTSTHFDTILTDRGGVAPTMIKPRRHHGGTTAGERRERSSVHNISRDSARRHRHHPLNIDSTSPLRAAAERSRAHSVFGGRVSEVVRMQKRVHQLEAQVASLYERSVDAQQHVAVAAQRDIASHRDAFSKILNESGAVYQRLQRALGQAQQRSDESARRCAALDESTRELEQALHASHKKEAQLRRAVSDLQVENSRMAAELAGRHAATAVSTVFTSATTVDTLRDGTHDPHGRAGSVFDAWPLGAPRGGGGLDSWRGEDGRGSGDATLMSDAVSFPEFHRALQQVGRSAALPCTVYREVVEDVLKALERIPALRDDPLSMVSVKKLHGVIRQAEQHMLTTTLHVGVLQDEAKKLEAALHDARIREHQLLNAVLAK